MAELCNMMKRHLEGSNVFRKIHIFILLLGLTQYTIKDIYNFDTMHSAW